MTANILVSPPYQPFTLPNKFSSVFNGKVWCGVIDKDPLVPANQVQIYLVNEDGSRTPVKQPISINSGGFLEYNGNPAKFVTDSNHSLLVTNSLGARLWYEPNMAIVDPFSLVEQLGGSDGFSFVSFKPSGVAGAVKRSLSDVTSDGLNVNVKWFGAKGDWDMGPAQAGTDDTASIASAAAFLSTMGSRRVGAVRRLYFPQGAYRFDYLAIEVGAGFGLQIAGDGRYATYLCANQSNIKPTIDCQIELIEFKDLTLMGSLSDSVAGNPSQWKDIGFKGKNFYNTADIDVRFTDCDLLYFKDAAQVYGRGATFDNCGIGHVNCLLNIVCDPSTTFTPGDALQSVETGMRNYQIRNSRTDQVRESLVKVTGSGPQKEFINGISIIGNDLVATVKLVDAPDATLRRMSMGANTGLYSFRLGVVSAKGVYSVNMHDCNLSRRFEETVAPTGFNDCIPFLINTSEQLHDVNVDNIVVRNLSGTPVATAGEASNVSITGLVAPNAWVYRDSGNSCYIFFAQSNCPGLYINGNQFSSTVTSREYYAFNPTAQTDKYTFVGNNPAPWTWNVSRLRYSPVLLVNGSPASVAPSGRSGYYCYDGEFVHFEIMLISGFTETSGVLEVSLPPVPAVAENPNVTASYGGFGIVTSHSGWVSQGNSFSRCVVNPVTQRLQLFKEGGMVRVPVSAADKSGTVTLYISGKYRA